MAPPWTRLDLSSTLAMGGWYENGSNQRHQHALPGRDGERAAEPGQPSLGKGLRPDQVVVPLGDKDRT